MKLLECFLSFAVVLVVIVTLFGLLGYLGYIALEAKGYGKLGALFASACLFFALLMPLVYFESCTSAPDLPVRNPLLAKRKY